MVGIKEEQNSSNFLCCASDITAVISSITYLVIALCWTKILTFKLADALGVWPQLRFKKFDSKSTFSTCMMFRSAVLIHFHDFPVS